MVKPRCLHIKKCLDIKPKASEISRKYIFLYSKHNNTSKYYDSIRGSISTKRYQIMVPNLYFQNQCRSFSLVIWTSGNSEWRAGTILSSLHLFKASLHLKVACKPWILNGRPHFFSKNKVDTRLGLPFNYQCELSISQGVLGESFISEGLFWVIIW